MFHNCNKIKLAIKKKIVVWILTPYYWVLSYLAYKKSKRMIRQMRVNLYKQYPPMQSDVGVGYKNGKLYDYIDKEYIK